jgi:hypothetical protein
MTVVTEDLIDKVYEASVVPELWEKVLDNVASRVGSVGGLLFAANSQRTAWIGSSFAAPLYADFIKEGFANPRPQRAIARNHAEFIGEHELFTLEEMDRDPAYAYLRRKGGGWCTGTVVQAPSGDIVVFSWERQFNHGPFRAETNAALDPLRPHLARAALISGRLGLERTRAAAEALGLIGLPAVILSRTHRLLAANKLLEELIPLVVVDRQSRIGLADSRADAMLGQSLLRLHNHTGEQCVQFQSQPRRSSLHPSLTSFLCGAQQMTYSRLRRAYWLLQQLLIPRLLLRKSFRACSISRQQKPGLLAVLPQERLSRTWQSRAA